MVEGDILTIDCCLKLTTTVGNFKPADAIIIVMALTHIQILSSSKEETS